MGLANVAIVAPGDMGHACGALMRENGATILTCLAGRSARSRGLAEKAGFVTVDDYAALVREADVLLSIVPPDQARALATLVAEALRETGADLLFADCNAISPQTMRDIADVVAAAGGRVADVGIIGSPPKGGATSPRFYVSGQHNETFAELGRFKLDVRAVGPEIGQASALKMCFATVTKGLQALASQALTAADALGVAGHLEAELENSQGSLLAWFHKMVPAMPPKAYRWVGEMEEIASTYRELGMTGDILAGAAEFYRFVESTPLGKEVPENRTRGTDLKSVARELASALPAGEGRTSNAAD